MQVFKYASMQVDIYVNKCEAIYMSAVAAFFIPNHMTKPNKPYDTTPCLDASI